MLHSRTDCHTFRIMWRFGDIRQKFGSQCWTIDNVFFHQIGVTFIIVNSWFYRGIRGIKINYNQLSKYGYLCIMYLKYIQCLFYIWKVVLSISKGFHLLLDIKLKSLKLFENASIPFEDNLVIH